MDDASADLILALQIQDLADLADLATDHDGEETAGDPSSDAHIAPISTAKSFATTLP